jgi:hypothetical protein
MPFYDLLGESDWWVAVLVCLAGAAFLYFGIREN